MHKKCIKEKNGKNAERARNAMIAKKAKNAKNGKNAKDARFAMKAKKAENATDAKNAKIAKKNAIKEGMGRMQRQQRLGIS